MDGGNNKYVIIMQGLPGSGKSTLAEIISRKLNIPIISKDNYRIKDGVYKYEKSKEPEIGKFYNRDLTSLIADDQSFIIDNINYNAKEINRLYKIFNERNYDFIIFRINIDDIDLLENRNIHNVKKQAINLLTAVDLSKFKYDKIVNIYNDDEQEKAFIELINYLNRPIKNIDTPEKINKRSVVEIEKIITEIIELILNGYSRKDIVHYCSDTHNVGERQTDNYLARAYENISEFHAKHKTKLIKQSFKRFNELYYKNTRIQDYRECRQVQESIIKLFGLNEAMKFDHTTDGEKINGFEITVKNGKR